MKTIRITSCKNSSLWYSRHIGQLFPLVEVYSDCYMVRHKCSVFALETTNIVLPDDAEIVEPEETPVESKSSCASPRLGMAAG